MMPPKESVLNRLKSLEEETKDSLSRLNNLKDLQNYKISLLGRKGLLTEILKSLGELTPEERPVVGKLANQIKQEIENTFAKLEEEFLAVETEEKRSAQAVDVTLPGFVPARGNCHPLRMVMTEIEEIFVNLGFFIAEGPDVETDYYNFSALNFPEHHPAREMQDTFYVSSKNRLLLRTHTSPVQIRSLEKQKPPIYMIAPGAVYRHDDDVTHSPMFHQVEGLMVDTHITFSHLKGVLSLFCKTIFGKDRKVRFRPSFFPFVEPGCEIDISCLLCNQKGCRVCGNSGWLEILGAGMVHPNVLSGVSIDPKKYSGFAFGLGVERIAMLKYGIDDIRLFFESDLRFLEQF